MNDSANVSKHVNESSGNLKITQLLNKQLADTIDLRSQARPAHFNVKGACVEELRSLFDGLARDLRQFADIIAQRIRTLGGQAAATVRFAAYESNLRDYPLDALDAHDHLEALLSSYSRYESDTKHNMKAAQGIGDSETLELPQVISVSIENNLWFLEAYLEGVAIGLHGGKLPRWISAFTNPQQTPREGAGAASSG
jgi:starvation-inducible DNA-binding protein